MNVDFEQQDIIIKLTPEGQDGKSLRPMGDWSATEPYIALDLVYYRGNSYIAMKVVPVGTLPTNTEYWMVNASGENETYWGDIHGELEDQTDLQAALDAKADADEVYTKSETDALLDDKADADSVYTKSEADDLLALKADADSVYTKSEANALLAVKADADNVYTKAESDSLLGEKADADNVYTKAEADSLLGEKADANNVYTKAEADSLLGEKADADNVYTKSEADSLLNEKADADEVYTKSETDSLLDEKADAADVYEKSEVYTKTETDTLLGAKADANSVYTKAQTDTLLQAKANSADVYTKTESDNLLSAKANSADVYTKTQSDELLDEKLDTDPTHTASGSVVTIESPVATNARDLTVEFEPVQDLHGYDNPWPAGGGKNLLDKTNLSDVDTGMKTITMTLDPNTTYTASTSLPKYNETTANFFFHLPNESESTSVNGVSLNISRTLTTGSDGLAVVAYRKGPYTAQEWLEFNYQIEKGSSATTYAPYSNICPISGHASAVVTRTGINIWDEEWESGIWNSSGEKANSANSIRCKNYIAVQPNTSYYVSFPLTVYASGLIIRELASDKSFIKTTTVETAKVVTTNVKTAFIVICTYSADNVTTYADDISINYPSSDHDYHQGNVQSVTIDLDGTRYGGTVDVLTGTLTVTHREVTFSSLPKGAQTWEYVSNNNFFQLNHVVVPAGTGGTKFDAYCSCYKVGDYGGNSSYSSQNSVLWAHTYGSLRVRDYRFTDVTSWLNSVGNETMVLPLITPVTVPLSANTLSLLKGENNVWSDIGDITLTYQTGAGQLAYENTVDYSDLTGKPSLGTMASKNDAASDSKYYLRNDGDWVDADGRYYTEAETDALLDEKADIIVTSASASLVHVTDAAPMPVKALSVAIDPVQAGSGDPSPDNVRPITGHTQAVVTRTGKNLLQITVRSGTKSGISYTVNADGTIFLDGGNTATANVYLSISEERIMNFGGMIYTGCPAGGSSTTYKLRYYDKTANVNYDETGNGITISDSTNGHITVASIVIVNGYTIPTGGLLFKPMVRAATSDDTFVPYTGTSVTIDLDGTRYGGTLDVLTGTLTVDRAFLTISSSGSLDGLSLSTDKQKLTISQTRSGCKITGSSYSDLISDKFKNNEGWTYRCTINPNGTILMYWDGSTFASVSDWLTASGDFTVCYPLQNPVTVQLSPATLSLLKGENNIWASTGDVEVQYKADTKLYIDKKFAELQALILEN